MGISRHLFTGLALTTFSFATPASAQNPIQGEGSMQLGATTISVGAGTAILDLPDVQFLKNNTCRRIWTNSVEPNYGCR